MLKNWFRRYKRGPDKPVETVAASPRTVRALSLLGPDVAFASGLAGAAIAGMFRSDDMSPENFVPNREFVDVLQRVVREQAPKLPGFDESARQHEGGSLVIVDERTPEGPDGNVPPEDIVGAFAVYGGVATYHPNPNYRVFTRFGLVRLPGLLQTLLIDELMRLTKSKKT